MKGIREMSMGTPDEPEYHAPLYPSAYKPKPHNSSLFDYDNYPPKKTEKNKDIEIKFTIDVDEVGEIADENSSKFDWSKAQTEAEKIAYYRLIGLIGGMIENYTHIFNTYDDGLEYEVCIVLTPK